MSRPRNFPPILWRGRKQDGQLVDMKDKCSPTAVLEFVKKEQITHIGKYILEGYMPKQRKKTVKTSTPVTIPPRPDNQPQLQPEALPTALETESGPKRYRRTKTEMEVAKKAEKKLAKQMREVPLDKPKWKCPDDNCGWMGDAPPRAITGINTSKLICPECKMVVLKNE